MKFKRPSDDQIQFLRLSEQLEESAAPYVVKWTGVALSLLTIMFVLWTAFAEVEEIVHAPGEIVPLGFSQIVQHFDGGIVEKIHVQEGNRVERGDVLITIDGSGVREELNKAKIYFEGLVRRQKSLEQLFDIQERLRATGVASQGRYIEARQAFNDASSAVEQQREIVSQLQERAARLVVRSPVTGDVKGLRVNTVGAVVKSGEALMEIVPTDRPLVIEARVAPTDIGQISTGQMVKIKVSAYDYSRYGMLDGVIDLITATTFDDAQGRRYYRVRVRPSRTYVNDRTETSILAGMTVEIGILTGRKTVFAYLFKPVHRALESGFSER